MHIFYFSILSTRFKASIYTGGGGGGGGGVYESIYESIFKCRVFPDFVPGIYFNIPTIYFNISLSLWRPTSKMFAHNKLEMQFLIDSKKVLAKILKTDGVISILMKSFLQVFRTEILCAIFPILFMEVFLLSIYYIQQTLSYIFHIELVSLKNIEV